MARMATSHHEQIVNPEPADEESADLFSDA
jgi:hypothetical protein